MILNFIINKDIIINMNKKKKKKNHSKNQIIFYLIFENFVKEKK